MLPDQGFLDDIVEHPDDDTPRLIYADWLEDQGEPASAARAEFIRIQCRATQEMRKLLQRQQEIMNQHEQQWRSELGLPPLALNWVTYERGFPARIRVEVSALLQHADRVFRRAPVQHLSLFWEQTPANKRVNDLQRLCLLPALRNLLALELPRQYLPSASAEVLAQSARLPRLQVLDFSQNQIGDAGLCALAGSEQFPQLIKLNLSRNSITARGVRQLLEHIEEWAAKGQPLRMQELVLSGGALGESGRRTVREHPYLRRVVQLVS